MYNYSTKFKNALFADEFKPKVVINMQLRNGIGLEITEADIWSGTLNVESATSASGTFSVGSVIANKLTFALNNLYDRFSEYDFIDATLGMLFGATLPDDTVEMVRYGFYTVTESSFTDGTVNIIALDNTSKLSHNYADGIIFPATLATIVRECCNACGVILDAGSIPQFMHSYRVNELPENGSYTYAGLISYAAQIAGCYARSDHDGRLAFEWYPMNLLNEKADGGTFKYDGLAEDGTPEAQLDGGNFTDYSSGSDYDSGTFRDLSGYHTINSQTSAEIATDNVVITGVKVISQPIDSEVDPDETFIGTEGYVYSVEGNPLIQEGQSGAVANQIFNAVGGMLFRPLSISTLPDPAIEAGDVGLVADRHGNYYPCFFSTVKFSPEGCSIACDAESANRQNATLQNALSAVLQQSKKWIAYEKNHRELAINEMTNLMSNALGFYASDVIQPDGSSIRYLHNKPVLNQSDIQWKITIDGVAVSTDGGKTWTSGITKDGNMVLNTLSVTGINCDWLQGGTISGQNIVGGSIVSNEPSTPYKVVARDGVVAGYGRENVPYWMLAYLFNRTGEESAGLLIDRNHPFSVFVERDSPNHYYKSLQFTPNGGFGSVDITGALNINGSLTTNSLSIGDYTVRALGIAALSKMWFTEYDNQIIFDTKIFTNYSIQALYEITAGGTIKSSSNIHADGNIGADGWIRANSGYRVGANSSGASGKFKSSDGKTVTVTGGIITSIS